MGYTSEVAIRCEEKAYEMLREAYKCVNLKPLAVYKDEDEYIIHWKDVKWSKLHEDAAFIMTVLDALDDMKYINGLSGYGYKLVVVGEDYDDVTVRDNDEGIELWLIRKVDIPQDLDTVEA